MKHLNKPLFLAILFISFKSYSQCTISNIATTNVFCAGMTNGTAQFQSTGTAPFTYSISPNIGIINASGFVSNLSAGSYTITSTDSTGCVASTNFVINQPPLLITSNLITTQASCVPGCDGTISNVASGGVPPYSYSLTPNVGIQNTPGYFFNLCPSNYIIATVDGNGCTATSPVFITQPSAPNLLLGSITQTSCTPGCDGTIITPIVGGASPFVCSISPSGSQTSLGNFQNLCIGTYTIMVTDANGCSGTIVLPLTSIGFSPTVVTASGSITASAPTQTSPITYSLNGAPFSSINSFSGLCTGGYTIQVQDGSGCIGTSYPYVTSDTSFPGAVMNRIITDASCLNSNDGSLDYIFTPPSTHYFCPFSTPCTNTISYFSGMSAGIYGLDIKDSATGYCVTVVDTINNLGINCGDINGTVYWDSLSNCVLDPNDILMNNIAINLSNGQFTFTDPMGNYSFPGLPYANYTVSQSPSWWWNSFLPNSCGNNFNVNLSSTNSSIVQNFADTSNAQLNNEVIISSSIYVPGLISNINLYHYGSSPSISSNGEITLVLDSVVSYVNASPTPNYVSISGDTLKWNYTNFTTNDIYAIQVMTNTNATMLSTVTNCAYDNVTSGTDVYLPNNTSCTNGVVWTSFDPNNKVVSPAGKQSNGGIYLKDSVLSYTINFQNTGTYKAHKVVLMDTLSDKVDLKKFRVIGYSHPYEIDVIDNHILKFTFNQIMLPDSNTDEPGSHGHIAYQIQQKNTNQVGDVIKNKAYIYFDYNAPVITNETVNTIINPLGVSSIGLKNNSLAIYPIPAHDDVEIVSNNVIEFIEILDLQSRIILTKSNINVKKLKLDVSTLPNGIYMVKTNLGVAQKLVIHR